MKKGSKTEPFFKLMFCKSLRYYILDAINNQPFDFVDVNLSQVLALSFWVFDVHVYNIVEIVGRGELYFVTS
jgi:hypothetical protein